MENPNSPELVPESAESSPTKSSHSLKDGRLWPEYCNPHYVMPDVIDVKVNIGAENYIFPVSIIKASQSKPYLGGYRNKINGSVYHHASTQTPTDQQKKLKDYGNLRTRETQTVETKTLSVQLNRESGTQMERIDLRIDNSGDVVKHARVYFTSDELLLKKKIAAVVLQRYWRGFMARRRANEIRWRNIQYKEAQQNEIELKDNLSKEQRILDMSRRMHPKTNADFAILYNELDIWRKAEVAKIKSSIADPEERRKAMSDLLLNETKALQHLQSLKFNAQKQLHEEKTQQMLERMSQPLAWQLSQGETALVHTPETQRAKFLLDLYTAIISPFDATGIDKRLECLMKLKWEVSEHYCPWTDEITELVDREADLLSRGRPLKSMANLRTRLSHLFLQFLQSSDCNPRASDFILEKK